MVQAVQSAEVSWCRSSRVLDLAAEAPLPCAYAGKCSGVRPLAGELGEAGDRVAMAMCALLGTM